MTHMRWSNDQVLAENVPEIDIFLGGHDHDYVVENVIKMILIFSHSSYYLFISSV